MNLYMVEEGCDFLLFDLILPNQFVWTVVISYLNLLESIFFSVVIEVRYCWDCLINLVDI
jgi:hypothetical protein